MSGLADDWTKSGLLLEVQVLDRRAIDATTVEMYLA
jgi:hypothetical protein